MSTVLTLPILFRALYPDPYPFIAGGHLGQFFTPAIPFAYVVSPHFRTPYAENFNYGFQYQLTKDTMVEAVYVGSLSRKAIASTNLNYPEINSTQQPPEFDGAISGGRAICQPRPSAITGDIVNYIVPDCARPLANCNANLPPHRRHPDRDQCQRGQFVEQ